LPITNDEPCSGECKPGAPRPFSPLMINGWRKICWPQK
jgi:hypothetical protein